jgi:alpha-ketoglutarate-dependent taurine dioxygenase
MRQRVMASRELFAEALKLPPTERDRLVSDLIKSLEEVEEEDQQAVEQAWAVELEERATRALRGESSGRSLDDACDDVEAKRKRT